MGDSVREPEVLAAGDESRRLHERWEALPRRVRRTAVTALGLALLAAATGYALAVRPGPPHAPPRARAPYPAQAVSVSFSRISDVSPDEGTFTIELLASTTSPVSVERVTQGYESLDLTSASPHPVEVTAYSPKKLILRARIISCRGLPIDAGMPFLEVTLRNTRAVQDFSVIPGERYAHELTRVFRTVCGPSSRSSTPAP
ncbi:hypothetical protein ACWGJ2_08530 [Streptomyces sp. NPDC054796]